MSVHSFLAFCCHLNARLSLGGDVLWNSNHRREPYRLKKRRLWLKRCFRILFLVLSALTVRVQRLFCNENIKKHVDSITGKQCMAFFLFPLDMATVKSNFSVEKTQRQSEPCVCLSGKRCLTERPVCFLLADSKKKEKNGSPKLWARKCNVTALRLQI